MEKINLGTVVIYPVKIWEHSREIFLPNRVNAKYLF